MRKVLTFCIILFIILSVAPLAASYIAGREHININANNEISTEPKVTETVTDTKASEETSATAEHKDISLDASDTEYIISAALQLSDESFSDEGLKAVLSIAQNNMLYSEINGNTVDEINITEYSDEFYERLSKLYNTFDVSITYKSEKVYIPCVPLSSGRTATSELYPYIKAVASPWDCLSAEYVHAKEYTYGISAYGLNYLCEQGADFKEALRWYLPDFDIK